MKERPILFAAPMVRALLAGTKTQTRRLKGLDDVNVAPDRWNDVRFYDETWCFREMSRSNGLLFEDTVRCPYGVPGDRLWVRETWGYTGQCDDMGAGDVVAHRAGEPWLVYQGSGRRRHLRPTKSGRIMRPNHFCFPPARWTPSIHMPRWASRISLEITDVRVQRLQEISRGDCADEGWPADAEKRATAQAFRDAGMDNGSDDAAIEWYADLWESINGKGSWDANPWVWAISFKRIQ